MKKVFIIDDTGAMHLLYQQILKREDVKIECFTYGKDFIIALQTEKPDLIITDYRLENDEYNGYTIASVSKKIYPDVPIILISGFTTEELIIKLHNLKITQIINKPIDIEKIRKTVFSILDNDLEEDTSLEFIQKTPRKKIIIVEDLTHMFNIYKLSFQNEFELIHMKSLNDLKLYPNKKDIKAIIMDYQLNTVNSFDDILQFVEVNYNNAIKIMISGHVDNYNLDVRYKDRFKVFLNKPIDSYTKLKDNLIELLNYETTKEDLLLSV